MKILTKLLSTLILASAMASPAFAGGSHGGGHGHDESKKEAGGHHSDGHGHSGGHGHDGGHARSAVGEPGTNSEVTKVIQVDLLDNMRFRFDQDVELKKGDVVRFVVVNKGAIRHEFSIGNESEQNTHREQMRNMPNMVHDDPNAVTVDPGQRKELIWRFDGTDQVVFACNIPGHAEAGMVARADMH